jgi:hypothetical protein
MVRNPNQPEINRLARVVGQAELDAQTWSDKEFKARQAAKQATEPGERDKHLSDANTAKRKADAFRKQSLDAGVELSRLRAKR